MAKKGWIKLHRCIQECDLWKAKEPFDRRSAWIDILLMVNCEDARIMFGNSVIEVQRGERLTSVADLAERWGWSRHKTSFFLNTLEMRGMISQKRDNKKTLIKVLKYDIYQGGVSEEGHQKDINGTSKGHQKDTNKNNKNNKELNKESIREKFGEFQNVLLTKEEYQKLKADFPNADEAIEYLSAYIAEKGYQSKSHYLALRRWVFDAVAERKAKAPKKPEQKFGSFQSTGMDMDELQRRLTVN